MPVIEITRLTVAAEKSAELQDARAGMLAAFRERPGFVSAELARVSETEWLDLIVWQSSADFAESRRRGADSPAIERFFAAIDAVVASEEGELWRE
ncbi:hypothetical protein GCM10027515_11600 [Schumannella luteola]|uniref:Heme-degrading monooxygenase HmoA n=1 Tax=Schumannella luteola TaxID=472059 RepID=A0A852YES8_9MICO|nr:antibiotic biosynthesis monooxygenase [Schumannella luteola]NYG97608.1 heme-degrading monooxygenase HmoA [Schumannella luteola]TPX04663.1 hypothetical protein FJ656_10480 [Schumannella luteola]